jgi:hypothetical protein
LIESRETSRYHAIKVSIVEHERVSAGKQAVNMAGIGPERPMNGTGARLIVRGTLAYRPGLGVACMRFLDGGISVRSSIALKDYRRIEVHFLFTPIYSSIMAQS